MTALKRPSRSFSFNDYAKMRPRDPPPGDRLDAMFYELIAAIESTQDALAELRRDDGKLKNQSVGSAQLEPGLIEQLAGNFAAAVQPVQLSVQGTALNAQDCEHSCELYAKDAEAAVTVAQQLTSGISAMGASIQTQTDYIASTASVIEVDVNDAKNWAMYSQAQAENAIAAKDEALGWAEYLAGPVVDATKAPAYIAGSPYPHGLYYQPVEGGIAGLWSAKWWALYAQQLVGNLGTSYLGAWDTPPLPGAKNPDTGQVVPAPIPPGAFYFDTTAGQIMVFDGLQWKQSVALTSTFQARFAYIADAGQLTFSGADMNGQTPNVLSSPSIVHVNGILLLPHEDYEVDAVSSTLTINTGLLQAGAVVQWDLLVPSSALAPGTVNAFKMLPMVPDGVTQDFTLSYIDPTTTDVVPAAVGDGAQLMVSLDGCIQEPGVAYTASGSALHFAEAPDATASLWAVWYQPGAPAS